MTDSRLPETGDPTPTTAQERHKAQGKRCTFGSHGLCCRHCFMGPCRVTKKSPVGVCGATADTIAARGFLRAVAAGCAAHTEHARDVAETFLLVAKGEASGYTITDERKLFTLAGMLGVPTERRRAEEVALDVGRAAVAEFGKPEGVACLTQRAPAKRQKVWQKHGVTPRGIDREIVEAMHRSHIGTDQDFRNLMRQAARCSLADGWSGSMLATELQDVLFGSPMPVQGDVGLGVLEPDGVNLVLHGHNPLLAESIADAADDPGLVAQAKAAGADGIHLTGICCTANEMLMRRGIPIAGSFLQQEAAIATGLVDGMIVDVQCVMQSLVQVAGAHHTRLITTSDQARMEGAYHLPFEPSDAVTCARRIVGAAIEAFGHRRGNARRPADRTPLVGGFTHESVQYILGGSFRSSYRPLNDNIINGRILGVAGVVGCDNPKCGEPNTSADLVRELIANDVLVLQTGCAAVSSAVRGLMVPEAAAQAGAGLREVCEAVGMPPVLHSGSCVDNSRLLVAASAMVAEGGLGEDISDLPLAGAAPEWMSEKAIAIGQYFVSSGVFTVFGLGLPIDGAEHLTDYLTGGIEADLGGKWGIEPDPSQIGGRIVEHLREKRKALGIDRQQERKLFDMKDRRDLDV